MKQQLRTVCPLTESDTAGHNLILVSAAPHLPLNFPLSYNLHLHCAVKLEHPTAVKSSKNHYEFR